MKTNIGDSDRQKSFDYMILIRTITNLNSSVQTEQTVISLKYLDSCDQNLKLKRQMKEDPVGTNFKVLTTNSSESNIKLLKNVDLD